MRPATWLLVAALGLGAGCNSILGIGDTTLDDGDGGTAVDSGGTDYDAPDPANVVGRVITRYYYNGVETDVSGDLTAVQIAAYVDDGSGGFDTYVGEGDSDGGFLVPGVPQESFWLRIGERYYYTAQRQIDLVTKTVARPNPAYATQPTPLSLSLTNMTPWNGGDIEFMSPAGVWFTPLYLQDITLPDPGATMYSLDIDYLDVADSVGLEPVLLENDSIYVTQLVPRTSASAVDYTAVERVATPAPITMTNGQSSDLTANFSIVAGQDDLTVDWRGAELGALRTEMCPDDPPAFELFSLGASSTPYGADHGQAYAASSTLFLASPPGTNDMHTFSYGDPFPSDWAQIVTSYYLCGLLSDYGTLFAVNLQTEPVAGSDSVFDVVLGPPRDLRIDAANPNDPLTIQAGTPQITWTAPTTGTADGYTLIVYDVSNRTRSLVAQLSTTETSMRMPPQVLQDGRVYAFRLRAHIGRDPLDPDRNENDSVYAERVTRPFVVGHPPVMYVDAQNGSDTNLGTQSSPFKTISHALSLATVGNAVEVQPGLYNTANGETFPLTIPAGVELRGNANPAPPIIRGGSAATPNAVIVANANAVVTNVGVENNVSGGTPTGVVVMGDNAEVSSSSFSTGATGIRVESGFSVVISANQITNLANRGVDVVSGSVSLSDNVIRNNEVGVYFAENVDLGGGSQNSTGGNQISCNTTADVWMTQPISESATNNQWDHNPPTTLNGGPANGHDVYYEQGGFLDTDGSTVVPSPCT